MVPGPGPAQGTGLAQWETMGPGPCPCPGPVWTFLHGTPLSFWSQSQSESLYRSRAMLLYHYRKQTHDACDFFPRAGVAFQFYTHDLLLQKITMLLRTKKTRDQHFPLPAQNSCHNKYFITTWSIIHITVRLQGSALMCEVFMRALGERLQGKLQRVLTVYKAEQLHNGKVSFET